MPHAPEPSFAATYWQTPPRPLESLAFIAPLLLGYEGGLLALGPQAMRNGADHWLRQLLDMAGFSQYFLLPLLTLGLLLGWHHLAHAPWRCSWKTVAAMWLEAMVFAFLLRLLAGWGNHFLAAEKEAASPLLSHVGRLVSFLGAGIYEELLFRLLLLPALAWGLIRYGWKTARGWQLAVLLSSLIFAAAHYQWNLPFGLNWHFAGEQFAWRSFLFRCGAGVFFALLFLRRGFGIAAGTHAFYDILVGWR